MGLVGLTISPDPSMNYEHEVGNNGCYISWCGSQGYPKDCKQEGCDGLVHADFGDENMDCDYWLYTKCDKCGESE